MKLLIEPADGVAPLLTAINRAKTHIEIAIFRFDRADIEKALIAAAARGVKVTALIAFANRGGEQRLRKLELRCLAAGIIVARTSDDLIRYHDKYILIDRRILHVLSFNFTHLDIDHSRGFGIVATRADWVREATHLFRADCTRSAYVPKTDTFVVSPSNARKVLGAFLQDAKSQLLIYDPQISDKAMVGILQARVKAGVEVRIIGSVTGGRGFDVQKLSGTRLHTRTVIRDRHRAFVGSQSLRPEELDSRRELGLIVQDPKIVKTLLDTFEADWTGSHAKAARAAPPLEKTDNEPQGPSARDAAKAVRVFTKELDPLSISVKKAVRRAVAKAGDDVLHDTNVKDTMKKVVRKAVKEAVKAAVKDAVKDARAADTAEPIAHRVQ